MQQLGELEEIYYNGCRSLYLFILQMAEWTKNDEKLLHEIGKGKLERVRSLVSKELLVPTRINPKTGVSALASF